jgi:hypothetical protein
MTPTSRLTAITSIAGPALLLASTIAYALGGDGLNEGQLAGALHVWAFIVYGVALVGLVRLVETGAAHAAAALTTTAVIGCVGGALYGMDGIQNAVTGRGIVGSAATPFVLRIPGVLFPVTLVALAVLLRRLARVAPGGVYALVAAAVLFPASRIGNVVALAAASDLLGLIGMSLLASAVVAVPESVGGWQGRRTAETAEL